MSISLRTPVSPIAAALLVAALIGAAVPFRSGHAAEEKVVAVGASYVLDLKGNPSTGYRWRLDEAKSEGLPLIKVEDLGYAQSEPPPGEKKRVGAPALYRFRITGAAKGTAKLVFEYVQPWVGKPARTQEQTVHVTAR